mgnify:CR=1 FL=1
MSDERVWVSTTTAAKLHDLAPRTIRKRLAAGTLPGQQVNGVASALWGFFSSAQMVMVGIVAQPARLMVGCA